MLAIYRRHQPPCRYRSRRVRNCKCPIWVQGSLRGEYIRRSLDLRSWEAASGLVRDWEASGRSVSSRLKPPPSRRPSRSSCTTWSTASAGRAPPCRNTGTSCRSDCSPGAGRGAIACSGSSDVGALREFRADWPDSAITAQKHLERLRTFFSFCHSAEWVKHNPATAVKAPKLGRPSERVKVFTEEQLQRILKACDRYPKRNSFGYDNPARVRAFVLVLRYTGLRIGDCVALRKEHVDGDRLFLRTEKSGESVYLPLPDAVTDALDEIGNSAEYFFWTGRGLRKSVVADWQRTLRRVFEQANLTGNAHMFRHTFCDPPPRPRRAH